MKNIERGLKINFSEVHPNNKHVILKKNQPVQKVITEFSAGGDVAREL
jgi:hypothetical protein